MATFRMFTSQLVQHRWNPAHLLKTKFVTLSSPGGAGSLAVLGNNLFLENGSEYNTSTGDLINTNFDVGGQLAVSGDYLFALNGQNLVEYDIAGTVISDHLLGITPEYLRWSQSLSLPHG